MTPTRRPPAPAPNGHTEMTLEEAAALVNAATGVDAAVVDALEQVVVADLRAAQAARAELAARVPTGLLRQVLLARSEERA